MEHCVGILLEPLVGLFTVCTEVVAICLDGCLQTCRESFRCIGCNSSLCHNSYDDDDAHDEESRPILQRSQPTPQAQAGTDRTQSWSSVRTLREHNNHS